MFVSAIAHISQFIRPIHTITRYWPWTTTVPSAATLFFINNKGWALTCRHVADHILASDQLNSKFAAFKGEKRKLPQGQKYRRALRDLERNFGYSQGVPVECRNRFINC